MKINYFSCFLCHGEIGEIVTTDLNNCCLPFICYRIGDLGEAMDASAPVSRLAIGLRDSAGSYEIARASVAAAPPKAG